MSTLQIFPQLRFKPISHAEQTGSTTLHTQGPVLPAGVGCRLLWELLGSLGITNVACSNSWELVFSWASTRGRQQGISQHSCVTAAAAAGWSPDIAITISFATCRVASHPTPSSAGCTIDLLSQSSGHISRIALHA